MAIILVMVIINSLILNSASVNWLLNVLVTLGITGHILIINFETRNILELRFVQNPAEYMGNSFG